MQFDTAEEITSNKGKECEENLINLDFANEQK